MDMKNPSDDNTNNNTEIGTKIIQYNKILNFKLSSFPKNKLMIAEFTTT